MHHNHKLDIGQPAIHQQLFAGRRLSRHTNNMGSRNRCM